MAEKRKITIEEVSKEAGVSKTTVSRYLNGKYEYMSAGTRENIKRVIEKLEYRPSSIARSLKAENSGIIGCVIADITNPMSSILVKGINDFCRQHRYRVLLYNTDNQADSEKECIELLLDNRVDGFIVNTTGYNDEYLIRLSEKGIPLVLADRSISHPHLLDTVITNSYESTYECIEFLHAQGYEKVAFFGQETHNISSRNMRRRAYTDAMKDMYNLSGEKYTYIIEENNLELCGKYLHEFIDRAGCRKAIFTVNGVTLLQVMQSMNAEGYSINSQLGICGYDDWGWAALIPPGITTIAQDSYAIGTEAAKLLYDRIMKKEQDEPKYIELSNKLIKRGSTEPKSS